MKTTCVSSITTKSFWTRLLTAGLAAGALVAIPGAVSAEPPIVEAPSVPGPRAFALTLAPVLLYVDQEGQTSSILELTGEARFTNKLSVALILGAGRVKEKATLWSPEASGRRLDAGLQGRYYLLGDFRHGIQLGFEYLYTADSYGETGISVRLPSAGVFAGYKFTARNGFTFDGQFGARRISETLLARETRIEKAAKVRPLINANVGWSF